MRRLMPLAVVALAACDPPMEEITPARYYSFEREGINYDLRAQFDPLEWGWFVRVWSLEVVLDGRDLARATQIVEQDLGPRLCGGEQMLVEPGEVWNDLAGDEIEQLPAFGGWQFVARCA
jgi:hypothetical protein